MRLSLSLAATLLLACPLVAATPTPSVATVSGFTAVKTVGGVAEYKLDANDLNVLLLEDHSTPVLTFMVTYRVGSRNEVTGTTGATHLLEHLMFKGSKNFHPGIGKGFDVVMDSIGGLNNATTWLDRTNYFENLPSDHLELAVQLEADRMRNLLLREEDRQPEMTVVRNEFERDENDPASALDKEVGAVAFIAHPYHHPTIGWRSDIEKVSIEKLREFYDTFYWPNNATVTVIGDFKPEIALQHVKKYFGAIGRSPKPIPQLYTEEPAQTGPRRVVVKRAGEVGAVQIGYKAPAALHADHPALEVLATVLSDGKTSRLYRALIDKNVAISADASKGFFHDETLFNTTALLAPGSTHEQAEKALRAEIERVKAEGVTPDEVTRAISKMVANLAYRRDGSYAIAGQINEAIAVGDWTYYLAQIDKIKAVTAADLQRVAKAYLNEDRSTTGWFIPLQEAAPAAPKSARVPELGLTPSRASVARGPHFYREPADRDVNPWPATPRTPLARDTAAPTAAPVAMAGSGETRIAANVKRRSVANFDVVTLKTAIQDVVTIRGAIGAGDIYNPAENTAIADLTAGMLDQGTVQHDKFALATLLEQVGATIAFGTGSHMLNFSAKCLRKDVPLVLTLLAEQLRTPRFDPAEFDKLKKQSTGRFRRQMEDTDFRATSQLTRVIFPVGHPNRLPDEAKYLADIESATLDQVKAFHAATYGPAIARLVAVGDVDDAALEQALTRAFGDWRGGRIFPKAAPVPALNAPRTEKIEMPGKTSVSLVIGQPSGLRYQDADYQPLNMGTAVFGSSFFSARLMNTIRNQEGLTYGIVAQLGADTYTDGWWRIEGTFAPELLEKGTASTLRELKRLHDAGLTADELTTFKTTLTGSYKVTLETTGGLATALLNALQRGYGPEWLDEYPRRIQALTLDQVNGAIKRHLDPSKMAIVMAGSLPTAPSGK